ncbi:MAG: response regulator, partial [Proteobacteria bacterium]|nr:response regulator [Pseudomonadota bacterium]MBU1649196.1 response regulator [Pseudomonadota bacterium]
MPLPGHFGKWFFSHVSIKTKTIIGLGGMVLLACLTVGLATYWQLYQLTLNERVNSVREALYDEANGITHLTERYIRDLKTLAQLPMIQGSILARDNGGVQPISQIPLEFIQKKLAEVFMAFISSSDDVVMIRLLDENGLESVRVERGETGVLVVPREELQNKSQRHLFQETVKRKKGEIYLEDINLRREHGQLLYPPSPVLCLGMPIFDQNDRCRGILIIDTVIEKLFASDMRSSKIQRYVVDNKGHILVHPDRSKAFGFELGFSYSVADIMAELPDQLSHNDSLVSCHQDDHQLEGFVKIFFDPADPSRYWAVFHTIPEDVAMADMYATRRTVLIITTALTLLCLLIVTLFVNKKILKPLSILADATSRMKDGDLSVRLETRVLEGEFQEIFQAINDLAEHQQNSLLEFEERLAQQTKDLSMSNARMQALVDSAPDAILSIRAEDRTVVLFSRGAEKMFGYSAEEVVGHNINMLMPEPFHSHHESFVQNYLGTGMKKIIGIIREVRARKKDGTIFDIDLSVSEAKLESGHYFMGIIRDISARTKAAAELAAKSHEIEVSASYERSFGQALALFSSSYEQDSLLEGALTLLAESHPFPVSALYIYDEWTGNLTCGAGHGVSCGELRQEYQLGEGLIGQAGTQEKPIIINKDDITQGLFIDAGIAAVEPAAIILSPIRYQDKMLGVLALISLEALDQQDCYFIERLCKQIGVALNNLNQYRNLKDLSEQLKVRGVEISRKNSELEVANKMKSEFLATMSHELRTPLNAIIGFSEVLKDGLLGDLEEEQREYVGDIFNSGRHLLSLINDILDLSKIEAGKMELGLEEVNIRSLLENSQSIVKEKAHAHQIQLELQIEEGIGNIEADARKMKQVVYNLLSNAVKFTPDGGKVSLVARKVMDAGKEFLEIAVTDTGIGISDEDQKKLFQPFQQVDQSLAKKYEGTGLGLAMVKKLVELHGGTVELHSELGKGTCLTVRIPYRKASAAMNENWPTERAAAFALPRVKSGGLALVVEDDPKAAELVRLQLEEEGFRVQVAPDAEQGLELARSLRPDLITLDIMMPGMNGWQFLEAVKQEELLASIPVVIVSMVADENKGFALGANKILPKPLDKQELYRALSDMGFDLSGDRLPLRVLVVDDDPKAVKLLRRNLEDRNITVLEAFGGQDGIAIAQRELPELIILDLMMPEVTGFDVVSALKERAETVNIPIFILSAKILTAEDRHLLEGNVARLMNKSSFTGQGFMSEVRRVMQTGGAPEESLGPELMPLATERREKGQQILVIEDNPDESNLMKLYLEAEGYVVKQAGNGREALEKMAVSPPDLITLDMMMPEM